MESDSLCRRPRAEETEKTVQRSSWTLPETKKLSITIDKGEEKAKTCEDVYEEKAGRHMHGEDSSKTKIEMLIRVCIC